MAILIVVNNPKEWSLAVPGVDLVSARAYLTDRVHAQMRGARVFNFCRSYAYQSLGYYVSLVAEARGHKPQPGVTTIQDMKSFSMIRTLGDELDDLIRKSLAPVQSNRFVLSVYFGRNLAKRYDRLGAELFKLFRAPFLRAYFVRHQKWQLQSIGPIAVDDIPPMHAEFVEKTAAEYFGRRRWSWARKAPPRYDMAILYQEADENAPSDPKAIARFEKAAEACGIGVDLVDKSDYGRLGEYDALFIRETTAVNHHTYRFARKAAAEGLVVVDDPESILKCSNKVYLAELLDRHRVPTPRTMVVHRDNVEQVIARLGLPIILKRPDGSFSQGVIKIEHAAELLPKVEELLEVSDLIIAQEFLPTKFDWRVGVFDRQALYVCKYHMAPAHWQIVGQDRAGRRRYGRVEAIPLDQAPRTVVRTAVKAANLIGDGLYGVDLKQIGRACVVIEVNDNPNIEAGFEDAVLKQELYRRIMQVFLTRIERRKQEPQPPSP